MFDYNFPNMRNNTTEREYNNPGSANSLMNCAYKDYEQIQQRKEDECDLVYWVKGVCILMIAIIGIGLNTTTICIIFPRKPLNNIFSLLVVALFASDTLFLVIQALISLIYHILSSSSYSLSITYAKILLPLWNLAFANSIFMTVALSIDRYISLFHTEVYQRLLKRATSRRMCFLLYVAPVIVFTVLFHIPSFFVNVSQMKNETIRGSKPEEPDQCYIHVEKHEAIVMYFNMYARLLIEGILPLLVLICCNFRTYIKVRRHLEKLRRQISGELTKSMSNVTSHEPHKNLRNSDGIELRLNKTTEDSDLSTKIKRVSEKIKYELAKASIAIVLVFVACQFPKLILRFWQSIYIDENNQQVLNDGCDNPPIYPFWILQLDAAANFMLVLNSSFNVVVYCFFDRNYRNTVKYWINKTTGKSLFRVSQDACCNENVVMMRRIS